MEALSSHDVLFSCCRYRLFISGYFGIDKVEMVVYIRFMVDNYKAVLRGIYE